MSQLAINDGWASDDTNSVWFSRIGGDGEVALVSSFVNYADMAPPEQSFFEFAAEIPGEDEAGAMFREFSNGYTSSAYTIWVHDEALSTPGDD